MGCGCFPDVRGVLDQALDDTDELERHLADLGDFASVERLDSAPVLPAPAAAAAAIAAGRMIRLDSAGPGALAVYLDEARAVVHVGRATADGSVDSEWRPGLAFRHGLFDLPRRFGEMVHWYREG
ncbi:hypothetical protein [Magnetospirillum sp. UT-4]|uniref:hypothetical protein n=1 Tax=Magnetospirillum sp. UT-4 TaxID=2681467 RepID=UPI001382048F|nr:hypothetical protein [Magnetospirillum sp. UT-4]CAA7626199.1 hypothetical protein MTBUT4_730006 [Magnetospirillum sp. UT-4]